MDPVTLQEQLRVRSLVRKLSANKLEVQAEDEAFERIKQKYMMGKHFTYNPLFKW